MDTPFDFQGLNSNQIYNELLKCPKNKWVGIINGLPSGIKSELVAILSSKNKKDSPLNSNNKVKINNTEFEEKSNKRLKIESEKVVETQLEQCLTSSHAFSEDTRKILNELKISTYSPLGTIVSRTMYIAGDLRTTLKENNLDDTSVRLVQIYLNIWVTLLWNSLFNSNDKKRIANKLSNSIIKKHLNKYYRQEVNKFEHDSMLNKSIHKHVGINQTVNAENDFLSSENSNDIARVNDEITLNNIDDEEKSKNNMINIPINTLNINKRFEYRLKLRDVRTRKMSPENYKEFAVLREKNFRSSTNILHEWLSITWSTYYNNGLKDTKISQIPSNSLQLFSFLINDLISSIVEDALKISYLENNIDNNENKMVYELNSLKNKIAEIKEKMDILDLKNLDFDKVIECFIKNDNFSEVPKLNHMHYLFAILNRITNTDNVLLNYLFNINNSLSKLVIDVETIIGIIITLNSKLSNQIIRGELNCINSTQESVERIELNKQDESNCLSSVGFSEEDDMFEAIIESATKEYSISNVFPYVSFKKFRLISINTHKRCLLGYTR
ncbi:hypothetical protein FG386_001574 [Cryptosporidium ryanae]|uniref:uncharacterized protein n=1 Tax=Cryptosporidium ryanae TaxID=515981 RepID=UPI00351A1BFC|nr:hypothetical protein FG386_001574 [Cryptosporidium ryanae]